VNHRPRRPARPSKLQYLVVAIVPALIVTLSVTGFVWAQDSVTVIVDGSSRRVSTHADTVAEVLAEARVPVGDGDVVSPSAEADVEDGMTVVVRNSIPVTVALGTEAVRVDVVGTRVADALVAAGLDPASTERVHPPVGAVLKPGMTIDVPDVVVRVEREESSVKPAVRRIEDDSLAKGSKRVVERGRPGKLLRVYRVVVADGVEAEPVLAAEQLVVAAQPKVIAVGTGASTGGSDTATGAAPGSRAAAMPANGARMSVTATGYSAEQPGLDDTTATGARARRGVIAVDPRVIPLGTHVFVPGYGFAVAADTGGAIDGARIDLCFDSVAEALRWGRRRVTITVLD
jgi:uncharacterized protein YabE (DUF348 family)